MKRKYQKPQCTQSDFELQQVFLGMSVYDAQGGGLVDHAGNGDTPTTDDDDIIWNDAKSFDSFVPWDGLLGRLD